MVENKSYLRNLFQFGSVAQSCPTPPCPSPTPGVHSDAHTDNQYANYKTVTTMKRETIGKLTFKKNISDFPDGPVVKNLSTNAGDTGSILSLGRSHMPQSN